MKISRALVLLLPMLDAGCATHADSVCENIGNCTTQSSDQIQACQRQAKQLSDEASASGCASEYKSYFACADRRYKCEGNVPSFIGCEESRDALNRCLSAARSQNSCGQLSRKVQECSSTPPSVSDVPPACGAAELCSARCYLDNVPDVCHPQARDLSLFAQCAQVCPVP